MSKASDTINDMLDAYKNSYSHKDHQRMDIACHKSEYEQTLDEMWEIYHKNPMQIVEYNKQLNVIKDCGCKVLRNSVGKHKIVIS